jgi:hypothetical protein
VLVPSLLAEHAGLRLNVRYLAAFLGMRLLGYLVFAAVAWQVGTLVSLQSTASPIVFSAIHTLLAGVLLRYAYVVGKPCSQASKQPELVSIGSAKKHEIPGAAVLGLLTGVSLCPPFVAAGVRAAEAASMVGALLFFALFFIGTSVWFVPFAGMGWIRRNEAVITVGRMAMVLIAVYYFYIGLVSLIGRYSHG